jgi:hypothetical protein
MNLSPVYLKQREDWKEEGKQEGRQEGTLEERYLKCRINSPARFFDKILTFAGDEIRPEYQPQSIGLISVSVGKLCYN